MVREGHSGEAILGRHLKQRILGADRIKHRYPVAESSFVLFVTQQKVWALMAEKMKRRMFARFLRKVGHGHVSLASLGLETLSLYLDGGSK